MAQTNLFHRLVGLVASLLTPEPPAREDVDAQMARLQSDFERKVDALVQGMEDGRVSVGQFVGSMPTLIKQQQLAAAVIGEGGVQNATPKTYAVAQASVDIQLAYFERWKAELLQQAAAGKLPSAAYIANRAKMYGKAASSTAAQANIEAQGLPALPFYPGQGTQCRVNCKCFWDIKTLDVVNGSYDCFYMLAVAEHCPTCTARSRAANPLRVRGGEIVNADKYQDARFFA